MLALKILVIYAVVYVFIFALMSVARQADEYAEQSYEKEFGGNESRK